MLFLIAEQGLLSVSLFGPDAYFVIPRRIRRKTKKNDKESRPRPKEATCFYPDSMSDSDFPRCLYRSRIKVISSRIEKINFFKNQNNLAFHPGPVQPLSGEGSPLHCFPILQTFKATMVKRLSTMGGYISNGRVVGSNPDQHHFSFLSLWMYSSGY